MVKGIERSIVKKFKKDIWRNFTKAINEYQMIQDGDKIAVCISGGKDSMLMAKLFQELKRHGRNNFDVVFLVMNPGYNDMGRETLEQIYADTFHTEAALVRPQITCGTHALALALMSQLRPGDELLFIFLFIIKSCVTFRYFSNI